MPTVVLCYKSYQPDWAEVNSALRVEVVKEVWDVPDTGGSDVVGVKSPRAAQRAWDDMMEENG